MPNYTSSGEENLRADEKTMSSDDVKPHPAVKGTSAGGESTSDSQTLQSKDLKSTPGAGAKVPSGVKNYSED